MRCDGNAKDILRCSQPGRYILAAAAACSLLLSASLISVSYQRDQETVRNDLTFQGAQGLDAVLEEPSWNPQQGVLVIPNHTIPKDPQITNTSRSDLDELAAIRLEFRYTQSCQEEAKRGQLLSAQDMEAVCAAYDIDYNTGLDGKWVRFSEDNARDSVQHFYYRDVLERNYPDRGDTTQPLFTQLSVSAEIGNREYQRIQQIGGFDLILSGSVLQYMESEVQHGLGSAQRAYEAGLFTFQSE